MRTVQSLIEELQKFPPDAICFGYETCIGEARGAGVVVNHGKNQGMVYCDEFTAVGEDYDTELLPKPPKPAKAQQ